MTDTGITIQPGRYMVGDDGSLWKPKDGISFNMAVWPDDFVMVGKSPVSVSSQPTTPIEILPWPMK